jgi:hypothetical protein
MEFLRSTKVWFAFWFVSLFVGLLPLPPAAELIILVGFLSHTSYRARPFPPRGPAAGSRHGREGRRGGLPSATAPAGLQDISAVRPTRGESA